MKLPWVSRELYEQTLMIVAEGVGRLNVERGRYADLLEKYHALKLAGAEPAPLVGQMAPYLIAPATVPSMAKVEHDELKALIHEKSGDNLRMRKMMLRQLAADRAAGLSPERIRAAIEQGISSEGVPA